MRIQNISSNNYVNGYQGQRSKAAEFKANAYTKIKISCADMNGCESALLHIGNLFKAFAIRMKMLAAGDYGGFVTRNEGDNCLGIYVFDKTQLQLKELKRKTNDPIALEAFFKRISATKSKETEKLTFLLTAEGDICLNCPKKVPINEVLPN